MPTGRCYFACRSNCYRRSTGAGVFTWDDVYLGDATTVQVADGWGGGAGDYLQKMAYKYNAGNRMLSRSVLWLETTNIPNDAVISAATYQNLQYPVKWADGLLTALGFTLDMWGPFPASTTPLTRDNQGTGGPLSDYALIRTTYATAPMWSKFYDVGDYGVPASETIPIPASWLGGIEKCGYTGFVFRFSFDADNSPPPDAPPWYTGIYIGVNYNTGWLDVTYTSAARRVFFIRGPTATNELPQAGDTNFTLMGSADAYSAVAAERQAPIPCSGKFRDLYLRFGSGAAGYPGVGRSRQVTLGTLTALIEGYDKRIVDNTNEWVVSAGDLVHLNQTPIALPLVSSLQPAISFVPVSTSFVPFMFCGTPKAGGATTTYMAITATIQSYHDTQLFTQTVIGLPGAFTEWYVNLLAPPGAGKSITFTLQKEGIDTGFSVTLSDLETTKHVSGSAVFAAGDLVNVKVTTSADLGANFYTTHGLLFVSSQAKAWFSTKPYTGSTASNLGLRYSYLTCGTYSGTWVSAPYGLQATLAGGGAYVQSMIVRLAVAPGAGKSRVFTLQANDIDTALTLTIADLATQGSFSLPAELSFQPFDKLGLECEPIGAPANSQVTFALNFSQVQAASIGNTNAKMRMLAKV